MWKRVEDYQGFPFTSQQIKKNNMSVKYLSASSCSLEDVKASACTSEEEQQEFDNLFAEKTQ